MFGVFIYDANSNKFMRGKCREKFRDYLPRFYEPGTFGSARKFDMHEGVNIYTYDDVDVHAVFSKTYLNSCITVYNYS